MSSRSRSKRTAASISRVYPDRWHGNGRCDDHPERHAKLCRRDSGGWHDQFGDRSVGREQHCRYHPGRQFHQRPSAPDRRHEHGNGATIRALQLAVDISVQPVIVKARCNMRFIALAAGMSIMTAMAAGPAGAGESGDGPTTVVQDENGTSVITQSGDPAQAEVKIEKEPGRTTVYRRSGGNTAIVTQGTGNPQDMLDWLRKQQGR